MVRFVHRTGSGSDAVVVVVVVVVGGAGVEEVAWVDVVVDAGSDFFGLSLFVVVVVVVVVFVAAAAGLELEDLSLPPAVVGVLATALVFFSPGATNASSKHQSAGICRLRFFELIHPGFATFVN